MKKGLVNSLLSTVFVITYVGKEFHPLIQKYMARKACTTEILQTVYKQKRIQKILLYYEVSEDTIIEFQTELCKENQK